MNDEQRLNDWFKAQTAPQLAIYNRTMADILPYRNSPRWDRERAAAQRQFEDTVSDAAVIYARAMSDLDVFGEITETTSYLMDQAAVGQIFLMEAAE